MNWRSADGQVKPLEESLMADEAHGEARGAAVDADAVNEQQEESSGGGEVASDFEQNPSQKAEKKPFEILCI